MIDKKGYYQRHTLGSAAIRLYDACISRVRPRAGGSWRPDDNHILTSHHRGSPSFYLDLSGTLGAPRQPSRPHTTPSP